MSEYQVEEQNDTSKSDIQARREARRRKILENSKLRLEKLNGRISHENIKENKPLSNSHRTFSDPEMETEEMFLGNKPNFSNSFNKPDISGERDQAILNNEVFFRNLQFQQQNQTANINENFINLFTQEQNRNTTTLQKNESFLTKVLNSKFHLMILSVFTYGFIVLGDNNFSSYSIFLPLLFWELTETIIIKPQANSSDALISLVLIMVGVPSNIFQPIVKITQTLNKIFKDVGVFMFSFVICHVICVNCATEREGLQSQLNESEGGHFR
ncbi:uncharacterized protein LOC129615263 [Condylostylus longicornis]|uniref:uncharacterized protein LOC129615263 n=1 Tax=Condylostylus longicornis TaxID=2530218 RepID=UPI00244DD85F|nr:uncharacterized protein LOC129615263 [Condylostylus longicornis]